MGEKKNCIHSKGYIGLPIILSIHFYQVFIPIISDEIGTRVYVFISPLKTTHEHGKKL